MGILMAAAIAAIVAAIFNAAFPANPFPVAVPGCSSFTIQSGTTPCPVANQNFYYNQIKGSCPAQADYVCKYFYLNI